VATATTSPSCCRSWTRSRPSAACAAGRDDAPRKLYADRGYDHDTYRQPLRQRGITPVIARRGTGHGSGLGRRRWVVERTFAWLHAFRRLRTRYERRADTHQAMISLACSIICLRNLFTLR
jgi:transposase